MSESGTPALAPTAELSELAAASPGLVRPKAIRLALARAALFWLVGTLLVGLTDLGFFLGASATVLAASYVQLAALEPELPGPRKRALASLLVLGVVALGFFGTELEQRYLERLFATHSFAAAYEDLGTYLAHLRERDGDFGLPYGAVHALFGGVFAGGASVATFARLTLAVALGARPPRSRFAGAVIGQTFTFWATLATCLAVVLLVLLKLTTTAEDEDHSGALHLFVALVNAVVLVGIVVGSMGVVLFLIVSASDLVVAFLRRSLARLRGKLAPAPAPAPETPV